MLQVIASSIMAAILLMEANIGAVIKAAVSCAAREISDDIQKVRGYQVIVTESCEETK